jgi:threonine synthase
MDIQVASNFERALFEASGRDAAWVRSAMANFARDKSLKLPPAVLADLRKRYEATAVDDAATLATIKDIHARTGRIIDPHTAVAVAGAARRGGAEPTVILSTAHAAKFPDAVRQATGSEPAVPEALKKALNGPERAEILSNNRTLVRAFISSRLAG